MSKNKKENISVKNHQRILVLSSLITKIASIIEYFKASMMAQMVKNLPTK